MEMQMEVGLEALGTDPGTISLDPNALDPDSLDPVSLNTVPLAINASFEPLLARLSAAAAALESAAARIAAANQVSRVDRVDRVDQNGTTLNAGTGRKTTLLAKEGHRLDLQPGILDNALASLSLEQRIAVKAQLLRSGFLG